MFLNTLNKEKIYDSVSEVVSVSTSLLKKYIKENALEIIENRYDELSIERISVKGLIDDSANVSFTNLKNIIVHHITPRDNKEVILKEGILTLPHVLSKKTTLSEYLLKLGFEFEFFDNQIHLKKDGEYIDVGKLHFSNLLMRLGGRYSLNDFNVNGYLFPTPFNISDCHGWLGSPEILKSLSNAYGDSSVANNYANNSHNYLVSFKVPLEQIDIEGFDSKITKEKKTELLIKYCINALAHMEMNNRKLYEMYNPIIMLKRDFDVCGESVIKIWDLKLKNNIVEPKVGE